ncbi:KpsF/GutQ family sugar-phosphate isomerase [Derxia gummosa]|uniref:KpsF/GutQ family sugar-phosphate isomerase n=1 Tax=Derxia gummosa DSM 723 TaxID=1121388 RepID=A0A8B6X0K8_9BURK|nr:KpsF/GutQ family sugar-phosphate isomerase [Derxia gummosa]
MSDTKPSSSAAIAIDVLETEAAGLHALAERFRDQAQAAAFERAVALVLAATGTGRPGRVVVSGIGKSGHVGNKLAASLASTGTPAFFVHPAEASHGDLGMITSDDVVLAVSYSGEGDELRAIAPLIKRLGAKMISLTGRPQSTLARLADVHLDGGIEREACPHNLAPTTSTTAAMALGDALVVALLHARKFSADDFARSHPGGSLGRRLLTYVRDVMRAGDDVPRVPAGASLGEAIVEMSRKGLGMTAVTRDDGSLEGIFTDGDLRRLLERTTDLRDVTLAQVMTRTPVSIAPDALAAEAARVMEDRRIQQLLVVDAGKVVGALNLNLLMAAKVI